jgi:hypothetical protein
MAKTKQALAEEVLLELGRADAANPGASAEDIAFVKRRYDALLLEMEDKAFWEADSIDDRVFVPLTQHVAFNCRNAFGVSDYDPRDDKGRTPIQRIEALSSVAANPWPTQIEYF